VNWKRWLFGTGGLREQGKKMIFYGETSGWDEPTRACSLLGPLPHSQLASVVAKGQANGTRRLGGVCPKAR
jgi:hypothetical protein